MLEMATTTRIILQMKNLNVVWVITKLRLLIYLEKKI